MKALSLKEYRHPNKNYERQYQQLIGIEKQKDKLLNTLELLFDHQKISNWVSKHHKQGLDLSSQLFGGAPLIILSGDVGCGKTALAQSIATPLAKRLEEKITVFETPSDIRGGGLVGEISNRITAAFDQVKRKLGEEGIGLLIIDEADDIATSRAENHAHHEDRAGLNVLIKQLDSIDREKIKLAVILITNRVKTLDPAVKRRAILQLVFDRPDKEQLKSVLQFIFKDIEYTVEEFDDLVKGISSTQNAYSYSDLLQRIAKQAIYEAIATDQPFSIELFESVLKETPPSPTIDS